MPNTRRGRYRYRSKRFLGVRKLFRLTMLAITGLLLFSLAFYLYSLTLIIQKPFAKASNNINLNELSYTHDKPFTYLFIELEDIKDDFSSINKIYILHINGIKKHATVIEVPTDVNNISKLYAQGNLGEKNGIKNISEYFAKHFAININGYFAYDALVSKNLSDSNISFSKNTINSDIKYSYLFKLPQLFEISKEKVNSDLTSIEFLKIIGNLKQMQAGSYNFFSLSATDVKDINNFDILWQENTATSFINDNRFTAIVLNATSKKGLASWGSRVVKNRGGAVIDIANSDLEVNESVVYTDNPENSHLQGLVSTFKIKKVLPSSEYPDQFLVKRADFLFILGKDNSVR